MRRLKNVRAPLAFVVDLHGVAQQRLQHQRLISLSVVEFQQTGITLISLSQNELRPTQPGFVLAAGSRLTPLVPALDSPKLSTPTVVRQQLKPST